MSPVESPCMLPPAPAPETAAKQRLDDFARQEQEVPEVLQELSPSLLAVVSSQLASLPLSQLCLSLTSSLLNLASSHLPSSLSSNLCSLDQCVQAVKRAGERCSQEGGEGVLLKGINSVLGIADLKLRRVGPEAKTGGVLTVVSDELLDGYVSSEDPDFVPTAEEVARAGAEEEEDLDEMEAALMKDEGIEEDDFDEAINIEDSEFEESLVEETDEEGDSEPKDERDISTEMVSEMLKDLMSGVEGGEADETEGFYSCPLPDCGLAPIGLAEMLSGAAIRHLTSQHDLPQDDITAARFHFSRTASDSEPREVGCGAPLLQGQEEQEVEYLSGHCLPKILPTPSVAQCLKGFQSGSIITRSIKQEPIEDVTYAGGYCLPKPYKVDPEEEIFYAGGHCLPKNVKVEPEEEIFYEGGHCLPVAVKVEPEGDVSEQEIIEGAPVEDYFSEQEFVQEAVATALDEGIVYEESHCLPETVQVEAGEVSSAASSAQDLMAMLDSLKEEGQLDILGAFGGAGIQGLGMEGADGAGSNPSSLGLSTDWTTTEVGDLGSLEGVEMGASCTGADMNSLLSQIEAMNIQLSHEQQQQLDEEID